MCPKEATRLSANIRQEIKQIIQEESEKLGYSQTEYIERLVEGTLPSRLFEKMEDIRKELAELRAEFQKNQIPQ